MKFLWQFVSKNGENHRGGWVAGRVLLARGEGRVGAWLGGVYVSLEYGGAGWPKKFHPQARPRLEIGGRRW